MARKMIPAITVTFSGTSYVPMTSRTGTNTLTRCNTPKIPKNPETQVAHQHRDHITRPRRQHRSPSAPTGGVGAGKRRQWQRS